MDLSINNRKQKTNNISFEGFKSTYNEKNLPVLEFSAPPHKKGDSVSLQLIRYVKDTEPTLDDIRTVDFKDSDIIQLNDKTSQKLIKESSGVYYRYIINGKPVVDQSETGEVQGETFNILKTSKNFGITPKTGTMRHSFIDSDISQAYLHHLRTNNELARATVAPQDDFDFVHNHFNKLGGSLEGIDYLLTKSSELDPYRYIISNPDIGTDSVSSHKYWPENLYQCSNVQTFKDLNFHLFERGKGYVADGAFTSQSLQSPLVQHVCKWGEASPWYGMLKIDGIPNLGILPDDDEAMEHIGIRIVNDPNSKTNTYDKKKPTYLQFYDDRLVSEESIKSDKLIEKTDMAPDDHYEITSNNDSAYMFSFEISPEDSKHLDVFKKAGKNHMLLSEIDNQKSFLNFEHFVVVKRHLASNATFWDGNRDIIKMNLSNSENKEGMKQARKYLLGVATYWTETVQSDLILRTAQMSSRSENKLKKIAENNDVNLQQIKDNLNSAYLPTLQQTKEISDYISEFPLQSLETSKELSAVFAQPEFNKDLLSSKDFASRVELAVKEMIDYVIPEKEKGNGEYKQYVIKTYAPEIIKHLYAGALDKKAINGEGKISYDTLKNVSLRSIQNELNSTPDSVEKEKEQVIYKIQKGFNPSVLDSVKERIKKELDGVSLYDFKLADSLVLQSKAGLNWRFDAAKDIGDLDSVRNKTSNFYDIWPEVESFWTDFIGNVRKYNPASYIINEMTDLWPLHDINPKTFVYGKDDYNPDILENEFLAKTGSTTSSNYSYYFNKLANFVGTNAEKTEGIGNSGNIYALRKTIMDFTTGKKDGSNKFYHTNGNQPDVLNLSHSFVDNHDKPRILHTLPLDVELFHSETVKGNPEYEKLATELTGSTDYSMISPKAVAVAQIMSEQIDKSKYSKEKKARLKDALAQLTLGAKNADDKTANHKRSEAFGVTPYEISISDLFKRAGIKAYDEDIFDFHSSMLSKAMSQQTSMWEMMNAIPGTPTLFNGTEFAQTGWETASKNVYQSNRNPVLHWIIDKNDGYHKKYKNYYKKMQAISGMYKLPGLSAVRNGSKIVLDVSGDVNIREQSRKDICDTFGIWYQNDTSDAKNYNCIRDLYKKIKEDRTADLSKIKWSGDGYDEGTCKWVLGCLGIELGKENSELTDKEKEGKNAEVCKKIIEKFEEKQGEKTLSELAETEAKKPLQFLPIYSYDDKGSKVLQIITNHNVPNSQMAKDAKLEEARQADYIDLGEQCPFEEGTILKRKIYKGGPAFSDETYEITKGNETPRTYIVKDGKIYPKDGNIRIDDTVLTFYKPKSA